MVELLSSRVADHVVEIVMGPMHSLKVPVEAELMPKVVEVDLVLEPVAMIAEELDAAVAEPMTVVAGILVAPLVPKEAVLFDGVVPSKVVDVESPFVMAAPIGSGVVAAFVLGLDSSLAAFAVDVAAQ